MFKTTLNLDALEAREVPAFIGLVKGGPQPEPPLVVAQVSIVKVEPTPPVAGLATTSVAKWAPAPPFAAPVSANGASGTLLPALNKFEPMPPVAPNGILFPVFVGK